MGRVAPGRENVQKSYANTQKFRLDAGEQARIIVFEFGAKKPGEVFGSYAEWVHSLNAPAVTEDGREIKPRKWFGNFICTGDPDVVFEHGFDAAGCPICAHAQEAQEFRPTRKHATNILRIATKPGTYNVAEPWSVVCLPWTFGEKVFASLSEFHDEIGDLRARDVLAKCVNKDFQNFDLRLAQEAVWRLKANNDPANLRFGMKSMQLVVDTFTENRLGDNDLAGLLGSRAARSTMEQKANELAAELGLQVNGATAVAAATGTPSGGMSQAELADMLAGDGPKEPATDPEPTEEPAAEEPEATTDLEPTEDPAPEAGDESVPTDDLEALLG